jgi:transcriptional regulator with XRE-family HTH domain
MTTLGEKIKHYRSLKGWNQTQVAEKLKMTAGAYAKIERNETDAPYSRLEQIAKVFGVTVIDLLSMGKSKNNWEKIIADKDNEIIKLQKKVIELLEKKK